MSASDQAKYMLK